MEKTYLFTLRTLAQRFKRHGLSLAWLKREAEAGRIPSLRVGKRLLFSADAVERALIQRAAGRTAEGVDHD
jgi:hypothetical protein